MGGQGMDDSEAKMVEDDDEEEYLFKCKDCGSHELYVEHYYTTWAGDYHTHCVERSKLNIDSTDDHRGEDWDRPEELESGRDDPPSPPTSPYLATQD